jgi:hypothetical protein
MGIWWWRRGLVVAGLVVGWESYRHRTKGLISKMLEHVA